MAGRRRFKKIGDVRRYLASIINRIETKEIEPAIGARCAYIANILANCLRDEELETRIERLEKEIGSK
jgi:hypothetical protein